MAYQTLEIIVKFTEPALEIEQSLHRAGMYSKTIRECVSHIVNNFSNHLKEFVIINGGIEAHLTDGSYIRITEIK